MIEQKIGRFIVFLIYIWIVANSLIFAIGIANPELLTPEFYLKYFWAAVFEFNPIVARLPLALINLDPGEAIFAAVMLLYDYTLLFFPCLLLWRKKTISRTFLVALSGSLMP